MKQKDSPLSVLKALLIITLFFAGSTYIFAWTGPGSNPPDGNVDAPVNIGPIGQDKVGGLSVGGNFWAANDIKFSKGAAAGAVLTSDAAGNATWQVGGSGGNGGTIKWIYAYGFPTSGGNTITPNTTISVPAGLSKVVITASVSMRCRLPADLGRSVVAIFNNNNRPFASFGSSAGNNNGGWVGASASTVGVIDVSSAGDSLHLTADKYVIKSDNTTSWSTGFNENIYCNEQTSTNSNYLLDSQFYGYIIYGY